MHRVDNKAFTDAIGAVRAALEGFKKSCAPSAALQFVGDATYVNRVLVRVPVTQWDTVRYLRRILERFDATEIVFGEDFTERGLREFLAAVKETMGLSIEHATAFLKNQTFEGLTLRRLRARMGQFQSVSMSARLRVLRAYGVGVLMLREVVHKIAAGRNPTVVPLKRALQDLAGLPPETLPQQLALLSVDRYRQELAGRMMNVALLSMRIGSQIGLPAQIIRELGLVAALHDIGRATRPDLAWASPDSATAAGLHLESVRRLTALRTGGLASVTRMVVAHEAGGTMPVEEQHPFTRIIMVAATYEWMTQPAGRGAGMLPDEALRELLRAGGSRFDAMVVRALVNTLGLYPVGSTVRLSTGENAIVVEVPADPKLLLRPRVKIVSGADGTAGSGRLIELVDSPEISILGSVDARQLDLNVGFYFFA
jgi:HD-GYP domain-containing protein (c-di-GMP phosphodiesterase class II)